MKLCPVCHRCFSDTTRVCLEPGHPPLVEGPGIDLEIAGTWVLERLLAEHPSGGTFFARSRKTGQTATVIVRRPPVLEDAEAFDLFVLESSLLAGLQEVSIAGVEEFGPLPFGGAYAVVEPAGDETLRELLDREGPLSVPLAASIGRQVALASEALGQADVPPGEISSDRIGLRRRESGPAARLVRLPGSPLEGGAAAEIPALGALLYEMLSGKRPPAFGNTGVAPPPIQRARPDLPESLGWLVMQCLHPSATARPRSAAEVARRLKPFEQMPAEPAVQPSSPPATVPEPPAIAAAAPPLQAEPVVQEAEFAPPVPAPPEPPAALAPLAVGIQASPVSDEDAEEWEASAPPPSLSTEAPSPEEIPPTAAATSSPPVVPPEEQPDPAAEEAVPAALAPPAPMDDDAPRAPKPPPPPPAVDSAITAEIPILRPRYSYRTTPPPKKAEEQTGPRPMFLEPPAFFSFENPPREEPPPESSRPAPLRPRPHRPGGSSGALPLLWQPGPPPPAPPPASPPPGLPRGARDASKSEAARSSAGGSPSRQIPISAEPRQAPAPFVPSASRPPIPIPAASPGTSSGASFTPVQARRDFGIDGVTIGEDAGPAFEPGKKDPRARVVWGAAGVIAAAVLGLFWFVIEATPPRRGASARPAARAVKPVEPPLAAQTAPSTAVPRAVEPQPTPPGPPVLAEVAVPPPPGPNPPAAAASPRTASPRAASTRATASRTASARSAARDRKPPASAGRRVPSRGASPAAAVPPAAAAAAGPDRGSGGLRDALDAWIDSTNARDLSGHMRFYQPRVNTFYLQRNVSRDAVRREKARLFESGPVSVAAGEPEIDPSPDGRTATVRFRKRYAVAAGQGEKRGEVLQEMQWIRTPEGWRIAGERDARVIAKQ